jgi:alkanesulfonate monooxygenase SsuD/methylene tetrahydromethanopterin reductase-like flavin-dependent oxidoreductase (luciferase family)
MTIALKHEDVATAQTTSIKFAYWVPNVSGGLVISKIEQRTSWTLDYNVKLAQIAERSGFDYALSQIRFTAGYGAEYQHESVAISHALIAATERINVIAAILPGPWHPAVVAKQIATISQLYNGRVSVNIVSGWFRGEFKAIGLDWLDHDERYRRSEGVHTRASRHLERGQLQSQRRLLSLPRLHPETEAGRASAGDIPGRQFARCARHGGPRIRLVFYQRQHRRGNQEASRRHQRKGRGEWSQREDRRQRLRDRA